MKKIVLSSNTTWSIYNFRLGLVKRLLKDYEVIVIAPKDKYSKRLEDLGCKYYNIFVDNKGTNPINDIKTFLQYCHIYKRIKPDISLHFTIKPNIYGNFACKLLSIPVVNTITGLGTAFIRETFLTKIVKFLYKIALKNTFLFFQNKDDAELFKKNKLIKEFDIVPGSGVNINEFKPIKIEKKDKFFRFLLIARIIKDKGIYEYVKAAKILKEKYNNVEFLLVGAVGVDNPTAISREEVLNWQTQGLIKYLGVKKKEEVRKEIAKADCVVLPSYREGMPRTLLEASSMAKPIITTNVPGCKDIVEDGINGFLCKVKDPKDLAEKMDKMLNLSQKERAEMGKKGREKVLREFDERIVIEKYMEIIRRVIGG